jgi:hypothetical protein
VRVLYFSDVHIEIRERDASTLWCEMLPLGYGPDLSPFTGAVDLLVLAGDIGRVHSTRNVSPLFYAEQAADFLGCRVILVPGNHEYYRGSFHEDRAALLTARRPGVTVLDRSETVIPRAAARLRVLGATLWTDYAAVGDRDAAMEAAEREIDDHRLIRRCGGLAPFLPRDATAHPWAHANTPSNSPAWLARSESPQIRHITSKTPIRWNCGRRGNPTFPIADAPLQEWGTGQTLRGLLSGTVVT